MTGKDYKKQHETSSFKFSWKDLWEKDYVICSQRLDDGDLMKLKLFFLYLCVLFFFFFSSINQMLQPGNIICLGQLSHAHHVPPKNLVSSVICHI